MVKSQLLWWISSTTGWRHLLLSYCGGSVICHLYLLISFQEYLQVKRNLKLYYATRIEFKANLKRKRKKKKSDKNDF